MRKPPIVVLLLLLLAAAFVPASPAGAHATLPSTPLQVGTTNSVAMSVPHEREDSFWNTEVVVAVPAGWQALTCQVKATWTCALGTEAGFQTVTWTKAAGSDPVEDERFVFSVRAASTVGTYPFPTIQVYNDGLEVAWIGPPSSAEPAPRLSTVPRTTGPTTTVAQTAPPTHTPPTSPSVTSPTQIPTPTSPGGQGGPTGPIPTVVPPAGQPGGTTTTTRAGATTTTTDPTETTAVDGSTTTDDPDEDEESDGTSVDDSSGGFGGEVEEAGAPGLGVPDDDGGGNDAGLAVLAVVVLVIGGAGAALFLRQRAMNRRALADDA